MMKCDVIRDLLPLYADDLASEASRALIRDHVKTCDACRGQMEQMCVPMEPEPHDEAQACIDGMRRQKRKIRNRTIAACVITAVLCFFGWWLYMETHFTMERNVVVTTDPDRILAEMPELALTEEEMALANEILDIAAVREALASGEVVVIPPQQVQAEIGKILPEDAEWNEISVIHGTAVYVDYRYHDIRVIVHYSDPNGDGIVDAINKTIGVRKSPDTWEAKEVYMLRYVIALGETWYEKGESQHMWFSFLNMP